MKELIDLHPKNIVVKMPNWIGDAVMATPILQDLRSRYLFARITALCLPAIAQLLKNDPNLTEILSYQKPSGWIRRAEHTDIIEPLKKGEYDLGILLTNSFSSAWWFWRGNVKERIGFSTHLRSLLLTQPVTLPANEEKQHLVKTYKKLLEPLGMATSETGPALYLSQEDHQYAREFLARHQVQKNDIIVGINPGAAYGLAKCWLPERFREVTLNLIKDTRVCVIYFGDQASAALVDQICLGMPSRVINAAGKTHLNELMALIGSCSVFLTNDSGPMHIASALNIPLLALFGSTNENKTGPYNGGSVIHKHVKCSPCYKKVCPIDFRCMKQISAEEVYEKLKNMILKI
jgi:heptosyltransferase-2